MNPNRVWLVAWLLTCCAALPALAVDDGASLRPQAENVALGRSVLFDTPPNYPDTADPADAQQLTDGRLSPATPIWYDKATVAWVLVDPTVFTIDLGQVQPIRGVGLHMGAGQAGVEWPTSIQIYVSDDGQRYSHVGNLMDLLVQRPPATGYAAFWLVTDRLETHGRFVKFVCSPINLGNGAYIMVDEVEVYRGDPAWLSRALVWPEAPTQWRANWGEIQWQDQAGSTAPAERPRPLLLIDGSVERGRDVVLQQAVTSGDGITFTLQGEAGFPRSMSWIGQLAKPMSTANCRYAVVTFQAEGLRRTYEPRPLVALQGVNDKTAANEVTLLEVNMAMNDGLTHTLLKPLPEGFTLQQFKVMVPTESDAPRLTLQRLELLAEAPEVFSGETAATASAREGLQPVELGAALNGSPTGWYERVMARYGVALDGARTLAPGMAQVSGIPFAIAQRDRNLAVMPESPEHNERVQFCGQTVDSRNLGPVSRDDTLTVSVDASAREAFLLLGVAAPPVQQRYGIPNAPLRLDDIECLSVDLNYDRGNTETAFPYSLADRACCVPARELGAYAVAVDPTRRLKKITLRTNQFGLNFALAGVTLNTGPKALVPELVSPTTPERTAPRPAPPTRPVAVSHQGQRLTLSNRWYEYSFDLSQGFTLDRLVSRANPAAVKLSPSSGLRVRVGDTIYTGRCFNAETVRTTATSAELKLTSLRPELPLELSVRITANDSPELRFETRMTNRGDKPLAAELCLPAVADLTVGDLGHTRLFFPQYRAVDTAEPMALRAPYGPEFSVQFMDVYSRPAGVGLMIRSDNREQRMADFTLRKDDGGVSGGVCFPAEYNQLEPGASRAYPPVSLLAHNGDFHQALGLYRDWVRSWYQPVKTQDEPWFLSAFDLQCYRTSEKLNWREAGVPGFISADKQRMFTDETFALEEKRLGHVPDMIHFYNWTYDDQKNHDEYGAYATPLAYEQVGGLDFFRRGIADMQSRWQRPVSLYTLNDRFRKSALPDAALAEALTAAATYVQPDEDTSAGLRGTRQADGIVFPPFGHPRWRDFFIADILKMQRDTGCQLVYMDVMPRFSHLKGYQGITPREDDMTVVQHIREGLPDEVALWSEYPFTDVASQWADGCLQYYFLDLNQTFARRYNRSDRADSLFMEMPLNVGRYALPRYRTICLPGGIEGGNKPSQVDAVFVNGEVFHEDTFRQHHSRLQAKINRSYVVKHQYGDCFTSDNPIPWADTAAAGLTANLFPGRNRNVWTIYNGRSRTYSGTVLVVPHHAGATYRDAWNDAPLTPVIEKGTARIALTLGPQQPGCVVQEWGP